MAAIDTYRIHVHALSQKAELPLEGDSTGIGFADSQFDSVKPFGAGGV